MANPKALKFGPLVLIGTPRVSMPSDWFIARVLYDDGGDEVVIQHTPAGQSEPYLQIVARADIRAVGTVAELIDCQHRRRDEVAVLSRRVRELESDLGKAREAVWKHLDQIAEEPADG